VRVLLDENLPHKLRLHLPEHEVVTVAFAGFDGLKNGKLMKAAEDAGFEVFVTADRALPYQQNMTGRRIAVVALSGQIWAAIEAHVERISLAISAAPTGMITRVDCGVFSASAIPKVSLAISSTKDREGMEHVWCRGKRGHFFLLSRFRSIDSPNR